MTLRPTTGTTNFWASSIRGDSSSLMECQGMKIHFHMPDAVVSHGDGEYESVHGLPPYAARRAYLVDHYAACPESWPRSNPTLASYFVAARPNRGFWLEFNQNFQHAHDVAIVVSVQKVNAVTGQVVREVCLEQYKHNCPVHGTPFGHNRRCEQCGFEWPEQSYLTTTGTPRGYLWLDGWRTPDGVTRQFIFTEEEMRGVATHIAGKERTYSLGFAFYLSREPKPAPRPMYRTRGMSTLSAGGGQLLSMGGGDELGLSFESVSPASMQSKGVTRGMRSAPKLEVGAGAKIKQLVYGDPKDIDYWQDEPAAVIVINYAQEAEVADIIASGKIERPAGERDGFLQGLPVGNPATPGSNRAF